MNILLIEPYYTGSHKDWADGLKEHSSHDIEIMSLPGSFWKWRMQGGAIALAEKYERLDTVPDLILATDMLNLTSFLALTRKKTADIPTTVYFHENQMTYPWSPIDRDVMKDRDHHYSFINYISAYTADRVFFNSEYHKDVFIKELKRFLKIFPDSRGLKTVGTIKAKSEVLHVGVNLAELESRRPARSENKRPLILWNHRWEHDKNPEDFVDAVIQLKKKDLDFDVVFLGECFNKVPETFLKAKKHLKDNILHFGYVKDRSDYIDWLWKADILPVTSDHDFFGVSIVQAVYCDCVPLLPERLSYPELVPPDKYPGNFYSDREDLLRKLEDMIVNLEDHPPIAGTVAGFGWTGTIPKYDERFDNLLTR